MIRNIFVATCLAGSTLCMAQDSLKIASAAKIVPRHTIKFSPMHLFGFYPTVQLAYELKIAPQVTLQFDGGIVIDNGVENEDFKDKRGYKVKIEPRYYFAFSEKRNLAFYSALEIYRNDVSFDRSSEQTECFDPDCQDRFIRTYFYTMNYQEHGFAFKMGLVKHFRPFLFDVNAGFGTRFINYSAPSYIDMDQLDVDWFEVPKVSDRTAFTPIINFRLGFSFR